MSKKELDQKNQALIQELLETTKHLKQNYERELNILNSKNALITPFGLQIIIFSLIILIFSFLWFTLYNYIY